MTVRSFFLNWLHFYRQHWQVIWLVGTGLVCLLLLHYWVIHGSFRAIVTGFEPVGLERTLTLKLKSKVGWSVGCLVVYVLIPMFLIKAIFRHKLGDYGWQAGSYFKKLPLYIGLYLLMLPILWLVSARPDFKSTYPFYLPDNASQFVIWEVFYGLQFVAAEFFFRGFLLFGLARYFGVPAAVICMLFPYMMIHFEKPYLEAAAAIVAGCILAYIALKSRSIWGGVTIHILVALTMDLLALWRGNWFQ